MCNFGYLLDNVGVLPYKELTVNTNAALSDRYEFQHKISYI